MQTIHLKSQLATSTFVLLWGAAAIFSRWGLDHASPMLLLILRFTLALILLALIGYYRKQFWPASGSAKQVAWVGLLMVGGYSVFYFQAMAHGVTPGLIATILGIQPILTLCLLERKMNFTKNIGLLIALSGLILLVWESLISSAIAPLGIGLALLALLCMTFGAILQKNIKQHPAQVLPLQYLIGLLCCLIFLPVEQIYFEWHWKLFAALLFLGVFISVVAQILLYRLLTQANVVNVTSLFYLVPVVTAILDYLILGNVLPWMSLVGMFGILIGIMMVFKAPANQ